MLVLGAMFLWSTVPVGTKLLVGNQDGAFSVAFISVGRLWLAAGVFLVARAILGRHTGTPLRLNFPPTIWLYVAALAISLNYFFYGLGLRYTTASATTLISQLHTIATVLLAALLLGERLTRNKVAGMALALVGVLVVFLRGMSLNELISSRFFVGNLLEVLAALLWPFYAIGQSKMMAHTGHRDVLLPIFTIAALLSALLLPFTGPLILHTPAWTDWAALLFLGGGSTAAAYWLFAAGLQRIETSEGAMFNVLAAPVALLLAWALLGEELAARHFFGLIFIVSGLVLIIWRRTHSPVRTPVKISRELAPARGQE
jgi:drug/metabolite transporter (DMT)-like permease